MAWPTITSGKTSHCKVAINFYPMYMIDTWLLLQVTRNYLKVSFSPSNPLESYVLQVNG